MGSEQRESFVIPALEASGELDSSHPATNLLSLLWALVSLYVSWDVGSVIR